MAKDNWRGPLFSKVSHMSLKALPPSDLRALLSGMPGWQDLEQAIPIGLQEQLDDAVRSGTCLPGPSFWFRALEAVGRPENVRVVILGQDPYHGVGQAQGLSFSVPDGWPLPPSLRNIYREIAADVGGTPPGSGNLEGWAKQGVLLLNDVLTVAPGAPGSHSAFGWQSLTEAVLGTLMHRPVAFLLWGRHARRHASGVGRLHPEHLVLQAPHPSPLSAHRGFLGCGHFGAVNRWLVEKGESPIRWFGAPW